MTLHKFAIGQTVDFDKMLPSISRPKGPFEIVSVLSVDDANSPTYRIKSKSELFSRAVKEIDLVAVDLPASEVRYCFSSLADAAAFRRRFVDATQRRAVVGGN